MDQDTTQPADARRQRRQPDADLDRVIRDDALTLSAQLTALRARLARRADTARAARVPFVAVALTPGISVFANAFASALTCSGVCCASTATEPNSARPLHTPAKKRRAALMAGSNAGRARRAAGVR